MRFLLILTILLLIIFVTNPGASAAVVTTDEKWQSFDKEIAPRLEYFKTPGAAIAIVDNGKLVLCKGYGWRDIDQKLPVDENTCFQLASISKFVLALTAGALVDNGTLAWNNPAKCYYPQLNFSDSMVENKVTLTDLLSHQSGLKSFDGDDLTVFGYDKAEILARVKYLQLNNFRERAQYSNVGFLLAGAVVGGAYGSTWEQAVQDKLFEPLKMTDSTTHSTDSSFIAAHSDYAKPYSYDFCQKTNLSVSMTNYDPLGPAGTMASTANDMSKLLLMLTNGGSFDDRQIISPSSITDVFTPTIINNYGGPDGFDHGNNCLGCNSFLFNNQTVVEKDGLLNGMCSVITLIPSTNSGIVILCNTDMIDFRGAVRELFLEYILGSTGKDLQKLNYFEPWREECGDTNSYQPPTTPAGAAPPPLALKDYCGTYQNDCYGAFAIAKTDGKLTVTAAHNKKTGYLVPQNGNRFIWFWPQNDDRFSMTFKVENGKATAAYGEWLGILKKR
ncbi:MAG: serine hydrolase [Negativicutes bacterium]